jgi:ketosteroid isomerase-like protein
VSDDALGVVRRYLRATEERRLEEAEAMLAPEAVLIFPGGRYRSVREMVAAAAGRYRWVRKHEEEWDVAARRDGTAIVITTGTLSGENLNGVSFEGVRYIDRFLVRGGKIVRQQVWNDLDASGVLTRR